MSITEATVGVAPSAATVEPQFDRTPPQDIAAEQSVLGGMLLSKDAIADVVEILRSGDFYRPAHATIFDAILDLYGRGEPADPVTVTAALTDAGTINRVGGMSYLHDLVHTVPTAANTAYYARIVADRGLLRRLVEAGTRIVQLGYGAAGGGGRDATDVVDLAQQVIYDVSERRLSEDFQPLSEMLQPALDEIEAIGSRGAEMTGVPTGFADLDAIMHGLHPGQLIVVAGRPGLGKSAAGLDFARSASVRHGVTSAIFSLEMSKVEIVMRLLAAESRVPLHVLRSGQLSDDDWSRLARRMGEISEAPLFIDDTPNLTLMEIRAKARRLRQRHDLRLLVVDYLQLMTSPRRVENRQQEVSDLSRGLKLLAKEISCPVVAIAQLNRGPEQRTDKRPLLSDLRESGCMPASTRLLRADNGQEITLGELLLSQAQPEVLAVDGRYRLVPSRLTTTFASGVKPVFRLRLTSGREVDASANHRFLTVSGWVRLDGLSVGTAIAVPRRLPQPPSTAEWDEDRLVLLAHLLGGGSIGPDSVTYATADLASKLVVEDAAKRLFGITVSGKVVGRTWQLWLPGPAALDHHQVHPVRAWLESLGLWGSGPGDTFIPEPVFGLSSYQLALFLRHLWSTGGSITISRNARGALVRVYYASTSRRLAENVQRALLRFGVRSCLSATTTSGYSTSWKVMVEGAEEQIRFLRDVGCHGERGGRITEALRILGSMTPDADVDPVPWGVAGRIADIAGSRELMDLATSDIHWDAIDSIVPLGDMPVFDATVDVTHNFIANGVVAHNSIEQDSDVVILLHREDYYDKESPRAGEADFIVAKHRNGPTDTVTVAAQLHYSRFVDMAMG